MSGGVSMGIHWCFDGFFPFNVGLSYHNQNAGNSYQWPFQEPKLEVPTIYKAYVRPIFQAYVREYPDKIWPDMVLTYLHFRILKISHWSYPFGDKIKHVPWSNMLHELKMPPLKFLSHSQMMPDDARVKSLNLPSGYVKIAIENGHRNSEFSHEKWWFSIVM